MKDEEEKIKRESVIKWTNEVKFMNLNVYYMKSISVYIKVVIYLEA